MSATNPDTEIEALHHVITRLSRRFPTAGEAHLRDLVADELIEFDRAWVRSYIPVLIEGRLLRRLRREQHSAAS